MINKVTLIGHIGMDAEIMTTSSGSRFAKFTLATNERYTNPQGQWQESTEWHTIKVWGPQADKCVEKCKKGKRTYIEGKLNSYKAQDDRRLWEVRCYFWRILDRDEREQMQAPQQPQQPQQPHQSFQPQYHTYGVTTPAPSWNTPIK
jgi:single-strand DNA-binding protein